MRSDSSDYLSPAVRTNLYIFLFCTSQLTVMNTAGYEDTVIWNPYGNEGMGYNNFVCVESVKFDPVTLEGGNSWTGDMALKAGDL